MPLPNTCNEKDPGAFTRFCNKPPGHDGAHGYQHEQNGWGTRRVEVVTWEENDWREVAKALGSADGGNL